MLRFGAGNRNATHLKGVLSNVCWLYRLNQAALSGGRQGPVATVIKIYQVANHLPVTVLVSLVDPPGQVP